MLFSALTVGSEVHDRYRVDYAGNGSWEKIVPKFQKFVEARRRQGTTICAARSPTQTPIFWRI